MTEIQITRTKDEPGATTLTVEAPLDVVRAAEKKAASYYAKRARIPGFRKGKVPTDIVRKRFGDAIKETVLRGLVEDSWKIVLEQEKLEPIAEPRINSLKFEDDEPVTFELLVEVKPEISIDRLGGFTITRSVDTVTDAMVDQQLDEIRRQQAPLLPVEGEKPKPEDHVRVTIATVTEGEADEGKSYDLVIGSGQAIPEIEEHIMTLLPGEMADGTIRFPDDFADETKRGQTTRVQITLHELKRLALPDLDDEFAREVGSFDTLGELRAAVQEDLGKAAAREADANVRRDLLQQVTAANNVPAPRPMVARMLRAYAEGYGVGEDQFDKFSSEFGPIVEGQVKRELFLDQVAARHELQASDDEIDEKIEELAKTRNTDPGKIYAALQKENRIKELERSITEDKVFKFLLDQSTITES